MESAIKLPMPTRRQYEDASSLPEAIELNRQFIRFERRWLNQARYPGDDESYARQHEQLQTFSDTLDAAGRIWREEQVALRQRIAERIRAEIPNEDHYGIADAVASGDYTGMAC